VTSKPRLKRILIVDDDPETLRLIRGWFRGKPFEILGAASGEEGLRLAPVRQPDLILLDLKMPDLDGISVARRLKQDPATRSIPIILLTACRDVSSKVAAFQAGADDYVTKPFEFEEVDARIQRMLRERESRLGLERMVELDEKTRLYNFRGFQRLLADEWLRAVRYSTPLSLVFLDIDFFKKVNDSHGHQAGDQLLREFAVLVTGGKRAPDVAARYGGEEFAIILPHTDGEEAMVVAERIRTTVDQTPFLEETLAIRITVSAGVATQPGAGIDSMDALVRAADVALYRAKDSGRNRVVRDERGTDEPDSVRL
jgi:two-component system cell cycle response regulator